MSNTIVISKRSVSEMSQEERKRWEAMEKGWPCVEGKGKRRRSRDITPRLGSELPRSDSIRVARMEGADKVRGVSDILPADPRPFRRRVTNPVDEILK